MFSIYRLPENELGVHLRQFSSREDMKPHPAAAHPVLSYRYDQVQTLDYGDMQIFGDHVGLLVQPADNDNQDGPARHIDSELTIWNWKTGDVVFVSPCF